MKSKALELFHTDQTVEDTLAEMSHTRHIYFPVLDESGKYCGFVTRRDVLAYRKKELILVDHNEKTQCVPGWEQANILEIIDHHRVGGLQTMNPIVFRNLPLGSTATIIYKMFCEYGVAPSPAIAGALCSAIISDTLKFRSPTTTADDINAAKVLSSISGVSVDDIALGMFEAGENLEGKSPDMLLHQDYKEFSSFGRRFAAAQLSFFSRSALDNAAKLLRREIDDSFALSKMDNIFMMLTNIESESTLLLYKGEGALSLLKMAFPDIKPGFVEDSVVLDGVVSRKKQLIPPILEVISQFKEIM